jgi:fructose-bisphosphate aldolase class II
MLINMTQMLRDAQWDGYAVGSFNVYSLETIRGVLQSAKQAGAPVIVAFGARYQENMDMELAAYVTRAESDRLGVDAVMHLDHCADMNVIYRAIKAGFTSVMYDGSALDFERNAANAAKVVEVAHACGVSVEAELGSLAAGRGSNEGGEGDSEIYTDPQQAKAFAEATGVDALAVSIGTVHGMYKGTPNIRVDILKRIHAAADVPLVLHGGSGTPEDMLRHCIKNGICKINVNTEISEYAVARIRELVGAEKGPHLSAVSLKTVGYVSDVVGKYMRLFKG